MGAEGLYRAILLGLVATGFAMSAYYRHKADRAGGPAPRRDDGPVVVAGLLVSALGGLGGVLVYVANPAWMTWSQMELPRFLRLLGIAVGLAALGLFWWAFRALGTNVTPTARTRAGHTLVTCGPYRWVRHPLYTGSAVLAASWFLLSANWFILAMCAVTVVALAARTLREEANLVERFGAEYRLYRVRTGRFLPRLFR